MATWDATIGLSFETKLHPSAYKRVSIMKDHSFVIQKDSSSIVYKGALVGIHLSATQKSDIETFYSTNEDISWQFVNPQDGETYTLYFTGAPDFQREQRQANILYVCMIPVIGTMN